TGLGGDGDRDMEVVGLLALDVHVHGAEVVAATEAELQVDEPLGIEGLATLDVVAATDEVRVEDRLLDLDVAEVIARAALEDQVDLGPAALRIHAELAALVLGIEETRGVHRLHQPVLR